jgi:hypothetical protein
LTPEFFQSKYCLEELHKAIENKCFIIPLPFSTALPSKNDTWVEYDHRSQADQIKRMEVRDAFFAINYTPSHGLFTEDNIPELIRSVRARNTGAAVAEVTYMQL